MVIAYTAGCLNPLRIYHVRNKIKVGISVSAVLDILAKNKGHHSYWLKLCSKENNCEEKMCEPAEFIKITKNIVNKKITYSTYEARINVLFVGPGFLKNDFKVYFNPEGKAESITPVKHWD